MTDLTPQRCRDLIDYEPRTGEFTWKRRMPADFSCVGVGRDRECKRWNTRYAGRPAFTQTTTAGYLVARIDRVRKLAHHVAFAMTHGRWPNGMLDHINGRKDDNRIVNLREASATDNARNAARRSDNSSGVTGVSWCKRRGAWLSRMCLNGRNKHLGYFASVDEAAAARQRAGRGHFHENHGRIVR